MQVLAKDDILDGEDGLDIVYVSSIQSILCWATPEENTRMLCMI